MDLEKIENENPLTTSPRKSAIYCKLSYLVLRGQQKVRATKKVIKDQMTERVDIPWPGEFGKKSERKKIIIYVKDPEKSLWSKCLTRTYEKKSHSTRTLSIKI